MFIPSPTRVDSDVLISVVHSWLRSAHQLFDIYISRDCGYLGQMGSMENHESRVESARVDVDEYEDLLPVMAQKLDVEVFVAELCGGFQLLADLEKGVITSESLRRNSALLGMEGMGKEEAESMVREGDADGDGALNEMEFCILMVRLSPGMMEDAEAWLQKSLNEELSWFGSSSSIIDGDEKLH